MIIIEPLAGLGNKIRVIESAYNLSKQLNRKLYVLWNRNRGMNSNFSDLFNPIDHIYISEAEIKKYNFRNILIHILEIICNFMPGFILLTDDKIRQLVKDNYDFQKLGQYRVIYIKTCMEFMCGDNFDLFQVNQTIKDKSIEPQKLKKSIGIHIRRTDNFWSIEHSPTELFIKMCHEEILRDPDIKFYLATDDKTVEHDFKQLFNDRICLYEKDEVVRSTKEGIFDAVVDLYNLSNCRIIYGTYKSSFSDIAARIGNTQKIVLTIENNRDNRQVL